MLTLSNQRLASPSVLILDSEMEMHRASPCSASLFQSTNLPTELEKDHARCVRRIFGREFESVAISALEQVALREWPIIVHPDAMHIPAKWARFWDLLCIENMDKRKPIGQTVTDLAELFGALPRASLCFDIGYARQVDPTMSEAAAILQRYGTRPSQLHVSEVNSQSKHDPLSLESILAFRRVSRT